MMEYPNENTASERTVIAPSDDGPHHLLSSSTNTNSNNPYQNRCVITPEQVFQHRHHASLSSNVRSNNVVINFSQHVEKAQSCLAVHKKHFTAVALTASNVNEALLQLSRRSDEVKLACPSTASFVGMQSAYDSSAQDAMKAHDAALEQLMQKIQMYTDVLKQLKERLQENIGRIESDNRFLKSLISRDSAMTFANASPKTNNNSNGGGVGFPALKSAMAPPAPPSIRPLADEACTPRSMAANLDAAHWLDYVLETQREAGTLVRQANDQKKAMEQEVEAGIRRLRSLRNDVVRQQGTAIHSKSQQRLKLQTEAAIVRKKLDETRALWKSTVDTVKKMKRPMQSSEEKFHLRDDVADRVGAALTQEKEDLAKSRHDLKKLARSLGEQAGSLEDQFNALTMDLKRVDDELAVETKQQVTAERFSLLSPRHDPREDKQRAIRTFPTLGLTSKDNGMSLSGSIGSSSNSGRWNPPNGATDMFQRSNPLSSRGGTRREHGAGMYMPLPPGVALDPIQRILTSSQSARITAPRY